MKQKKYEKYVLKGVPTQAHKTIKKALRSKENNNPTDRQKILRHKLSNLRLRKQDDYNEVPLRGTRRGMESSTER